MKRRTPTKQLTSGREMVADHFELLPPESREHSERETRETVVPEDCQLMQQNGLGGVDPLCLSKKLLNRTPDSDAEGVGVL